ncbi:hypothetical protein KBB08_01155 [Candidatus Gracilibacteria bacterium]|nr:hypothetical protein [Candidatus Gracilibacteria bacterium]
MKLFFLGLASCIGLLQLIVFFQNLAAANEATVSYLTATVDMNSGMIMFLGFVLGAFGCLSLILYFTGGKLPLNSGDDISASSGEW